MLTYLNWLMGLYSDDLGEECPYIERIFRRVLMGYFDGDYKAICIWLLDVSDFS